MAEHLTGKFVSIHGLTEPINVRSFTEASFHRVAQSLSPAEANGLQGLCVGWNSKDAEHIVLSCSGDILQIVDGFLQEADPVSPEDGGFDVSCHLDGDITEEVALSISGCLAEKGFCLVQHFQMREVRAEASSLASRRYDYQCLAPEFADAYLGRDSHDMKVAWLREDDPADPISDSVNRCDRDLTHLGYLAAASVSQVLGTGLWGRSAGLLRVSHASEHEKLWMTQPLSITQSEVEDGDVARYIQFCQRRRFLLISFIECEGGDILLVPEWNVDGEGGILLPLSPNKVLIIDLDIWGYHYRPTGKSMAIQSWLLGQSPTALGGLSFSGFDDDDLLEERAWSGPAKPEGRRTRAMALNCRLPGSVDDDFAEFRSMVNGGTDGVTGFKEIGIRFDWEPYYTTDKTQAMNSSMTYTRHAAFKDQSYVTDFDKELCQIGEGPLTNPSHNIVIESCFMTLTKAGYTRKTMSGKPIGLYIGDNGGCGDWQYNTFGPGVTHPAATIERFNLASQESVVLTTYNSTMAARPLYLFNLTGVGRAIDTACSASLSATATMQSDMCNNSATKRYQEGISMGVNTLTHVAPFLGFCAQGMLSMKGRSFTYDGNGDGYSRGEGSCAFFWRRSAEGDKAMEDRDHDLSYCTLLGVLANCDGRSASITAPNGPSQSELIRNSMRQAGLSANDVSATECHGTGTPLGDPIEVGALKVVWRDRTSGPIVLTSKKSNFCHTEANAGLAGLTSVVMMLYSCTGVPALHLRELNPNLDVAGYPVGFLSESYDFQTTNGSVGCSSFGVGGTNARADVWHNARAGYLSERKRNPFKAHYVQKTCPICLGPMCWICGAAIPTNAPYGKHQCSLIREGFEEYGHCSLCYQGNYVFGELIEDKRPKRRYDKIYAIGSWDGYSSMSEMEAIDDGLYSCVVPIAETGCEQFYISLGIDGSRGYFYPVTDFATSTARVQGPSPDTRGRQWLLDARMDRAPDQPAIANTSIFDFSVEMADGTSKSLHSFKSSVTLVVNTASKCGFVSQYKGLQALYEQLGAKGLTILAFPCNQFEQEPGENSEIQTFVQSKYGVTFPVLAKIDVNGPTSNPLFDFLKNSVSGAVPKASWAPNLFPEVKDIQWNFTKFLCVDGQPIKRFSFDVEPEKLLQDIRAALVQRRPGELPRAMRINLEWHDSITRVFWQAVDEPTTEPEVHLQKEIPRGYFITGTFSRWTFQEMLPGAHPGEYKGKFTIGTTGTEEFQLVRDIDRRQCIHPATSVSRQEVRTKDSVPVRGPDPYGEGKHWKVTGTCGDVVEVQLIVNDGRISVSVLSPSIKPCTWYSSDPGRTYYVVGSLTGGAFREMEADPEHEGVHFCRMTRSYRFAEKDFQIVIDKDTNLTLYPTAKIGRLGQCFMKGPDAYSQGYSWHVEDVAGGTDLIIVFDGRQVDRRSMVYWTPADSSIWAEDGDLDALPE
jgi:polyketide synthase-associated protein